MENSKDRRAWWATTVHGAAKMETTECLILSFINVYILGMTSFRSTSNCLENYYSKAITDSI